tara:strand:- start:571 stop:723 length:153 start_codon:yes stop_codon:yes gene_type:complete
MGKYTTIQVKKETHAKLHEYCKENGYSLSGLVERLIKREVEVSGEILRVK